ncbi:phosphatase PAP2 family protein [soil metagenome]
MNTRVSPDGHGWLAQIDRVWAIRLNRFAASYPAVCLLLRCASRLGDGVLWYSLLAIVLCVPGPVARACALHMIAVGLISLLAYLGLKRTLGRPRPHLSCTEIRVHARILDQFSFPSGHSVHAAAFTTVFACHYPAVALILSPIAALILVSRVVLGLHYPSDVIAGAAMGAGIALFTASWF